MMVDKKSNCYAIGEEARPLLLLREGGSGEV